MATDFASVWASRLHASISTTLIIYTHAVDASHRDGIEAVERELFVVLGPQWTTNGARAGTGPTHK